MFLCDEAAADFVFIKEDIKLENVPVVNSLAKLIYFFYSDHGL